jgi:hypothetical protein
MPPGNTCPYHLGRSPPTAKDEDMTDKGVSGKLLLNDPGQTIKATTHVRHTGGELCGGVN